MGHRINYANYLYEKFLYAETPLGQELAIAASGQLYQLLVYEKLF
jgi:hypothetical protein